MFCGNCGAENASGAKFCKVCGKPLSSGGENANKSSMEGDFSVKKSSVNSRVDMGGIIDELKSLPKRTVAIVFVAIVSLIVIIAMASNASKTINLDDYLTFESEGYDGRGIVKATIDWDAIEQKYGGKVYFTYEAQNEYGAFLDTITPVEGIRDFVNLELSESSNLSNGDTIEYTWDIDEDLTKYIKCNVKHKDGSYSVSGLEEIGYFDPFVGVEVSYTGTAPNGKAILEKTPTDNGLYYDIKNGFNVSNGDKVDVVVSYGWYTEESYIEQFGQLPSSMSKEYIVEGLDECVTSYTDIDDALIAEMKSQAEDTIYSYAAKNYDKAISLGTLEYVGYVFCGTKQGVGYWSNYNSLYIIYRGNVTHSEGEFESTDVFFPVKFSNFLKNEEGVHYDQCEGVVGSTYLSNSWYRINGYINPLSAYVDIAESNKADYSVECGDGFESYSEYTLLSSLADIDSTYLSELEEKATESVLSSIENYYDSAHVDNLEVKGEYLLVAKNQGADFAKNNILIVVLGGDLRNDRGGFEDCNVLYPVEFDGVVSLPDNWMYMQNNGIVGKSRIKDTYLWINGYVDGAEMFKDLVTGRRDNYTYEMSEGLKSFGE